MATQMPRWLRDKMTWLVVFTAIAAASSSYSAYKIYMMTDGKAIPTALPLKEAVGSLCDTRMSDMHFVTLRATRPHTSSCYA